MLSIGWSVFCCSLILVIVYFFELVSLQSSENSDNFQYSHHDPIKNSYEFGYSVEPNRNFHHEKRDQNGITFGCYGFVDENGKLQVTHYLSDGRGYRVLDPMKPVQVYIPFEAADGDEPIETKPWMATFLPRGCSLIANRRGPAMIFRPPSATNFGSLPTTPDVTKRPATIEGSASAVEMQTNRTEADICCKTIIHGDQSDEH
ncbi:uncharacterized protein LOC129746992 isoform X2 [Uranotaenia lowii]|uniref:uncharacterized protein LOC129746992 isoform X2 n=1 Tax=Uranotaenia lowii TaxID=190385 RepID=UPI0024794EBC|nr:uncharacterized protein LOC129746992 isoform X2 [Uranotaenia lowii]